MPIKLPATPLVLTLTQGSADAFVQTSISTGLQSRQAYRLLGIAWQWQSVISVASGAESSFCVTRRSKAAYPLLSDLDVIQAFGWISQITTSGMINKDRNGYWKPDVETAIVEETIYASLDSTSTGVANSVILRLDVEIDSISDVDKLSLIARSLSN